MMTCRVMIEITQGDGSAMRWEHSGQCADAGAFVLLGRAFEVAQRETASSFADAVTGFCAGALIAREDLAEALRLMESVARMPSSPPTAHPAPASTPPTAPPPPA